MADGAGAAAPILRADGLRGILDDVQIVPRGDTHDGVHVGHLAVEVDRHDGARAWGDGRLDEGRIDVVAGRVDIDKDRHRAEPVDAAARCEEGVRGGDDLVARLDAEGHQRDNERVGARCDADAVGCARIGRNLALQPLHFGAADEILRVGHAIDGRANLLPNRRILRLQVEQGNGLRVRHLTGCPFVPVAGLQVTGCRFGLSHWACIQHD